MLALCHHFDGKYTTNHSTIQIFHQKSTQCRILLLLLHPINKNTTRNAQIQTYPRENYDENGKPEREVMVTNLDQPEERWTVYKKNAEELANRHHEEVDLTKQPVITRTLQDGKLSWLEKTYYNERGEITLMEQAYYGDGLCEDFSVTPHYTLVSEFTYEYDEYGNWILQYMCAKDGMGPDELFIREIEYQTE